MIYDKARDLAKAMAESEEYVSYKNAKEKAFANDTTKALLKEYMTLRIRMQGALVSGQKDERLQKIGEVLQLNPDASAYLMAEYRLNTMLGDVYKILADGIDLDLGLSED
mgnify:CR=1 FL=1